MVASIILSLSRTLSVHAAISRRNIATLHRRTDHLTSGSVEIKTEWVSAAILSEVYGGGSRSASMNSRKRSRSQTSAGKEDEPDDDNW